MIGARGERTFHPGEASLCNPGKQLGLTDLATFFQLDHRGRNKAAVTVQQQDKRRKMTLRSGCWKYGKTCSGYTCLVGAAERIY